MYAAVLDPAQELVVERFPAPSYVRPAGLSWDTVGIYNELRATIGPEWFHKQDVLDLDVGRTVYDRMARELRTAGLVEYHPFHGYRLLPDPVDPYTGFPDTENQDARIKYFPKGSTSSPTTRTEKKPTAKPYRAAEPPMGEAPSQNPVSTVGEKPGGKSTAPKKKLSWKCRSLAWDVVRKTKATHTKSIAWQIHHMSESYGYTPEAAQEKLIEWGSHGVPLKWHDVLKPALDAGEDPAGYLSTADPRGAFRPAPVDVVDVADFRETVAKEEPRPELRAAVLELTKHCPAAARQKDVGSKLLQEILCLNIEPTPDQTRAGVRRWASRGKSLDFEGMETYYAIASEIAAVVHDDADDWGATVEVW